MAGPLIPARWLRAGLPWLRSFGLIGGAYVSREIRLVRPTNDAGMRDTWVADHFGRQAQVAVTFAAGHFDAQGRRIELPPEVTAAEAERFARRAQLTARVASPHLVQIFETGEIKGVPFIVTELLEGKSLRQRLVNEGALSLAEAQAVVQQTAGWLSSARTLQVSHGDIRSDHLFLLAGRREPFVKMANLGAGAKPSAPRADEVVSLLDQAYSSPERLLRGSGDDLQSDLWALAVSLYELLTTILPFEAPTPAGVAVAICNGEFAQPTHYRADLPATIDAWFARAFAREPNARYLDPTEFLQTFSRALDVSESEESTGSIPAAVSASVAAPADAAPSLAAAPDAMSERGAWADGEEEDDEEEEDRTVKWDLPSDWAPGSSPRGAGPLGVGPLGVAPLGASIPPPLPNRFPSSPLPPMAASSATRVTSAALRPAAAFFTGDLARVARLPPAPSSFSAAAMPVFRGQPAALKLPRRIGVLGRGLLFGAGLGALSALSLWIMQSVSSSGEDSSSSSEFSLEPSLDDEGNAIAERPSARRVVDPNELPRIIQTRDLPTVPDDVDEESFEEGAEAPITTATVEPEPLAPSRAASRVPPSAPSRANSGARAQAPAAVHARAPTKTQPAEPQPAVQPTAAARAALGLGLAGQRPAAALPSRPRTGASKQSKAAANCNPPYFFDSNNIRRLKLECL